MNRTNPTRVRRRGAVLVAALVCMAIVMALIGAMLLAAIKNGRQLHVQRDLRQCELLLAAGIDLAAHRLANDTAYQGESWTLAAETGEGQVTIEVAVATQQESQQLRVVAEYPLGNETSIRRSRTLPLPLRTPSAQE